MGGTRFIGRAIVEELLSHGHSVCVIHRGTTEPEGLPELQHIHSPRSDLGAVAPQIREFQPDAFIDTCAFRRQDTAAVLKEVGWIERLLVLSSCDVYRAYGSLNSGVVTDPIPLSEDSPVRERRYPYRGVIPGMDDYEKLDVEEQYLEKNAVVCRLGVVYGPHDYQRREEFVLRRIRAGRTRMPIGSGNWLMSRSFVKDVAAGVRLSIDSMPSEGLVLNLVEPQTLTVRLWVEAIVRASGADLELVPVPEEKLPPDLGATAAVGQHMLITSRAPQLLVWSCTPLEEAIATSVGWHLANPPADTDMDFSADDQAIQAL